MKLPIYQSVHVVPIDVKITAHSVVPIDVKITAHSVVPIDVKALRLTEASLEG